jgi:uncharacterized protein (TIGR00369 family)
MTDDVNAAAVPDGFQRHFRTSPLTDPWEPIYSRKTETALILGLHLRKEHCNSRGFAHGGLLSALADNAMGLSCGLALGGARLVTVNLTVDYLGSSQVGAWLEIEPTFVRSGKQKCAFLPACGCSARSLCGPQTGGAPAIGRCRSRLILQMIALKDDQPTDEDFEDATMQDRSGSLDGESGDRRCGS